MRPLMERVLSRREILKAYLSPVATEEDHDGGVIMPFGGNDWLALTQEPTLEPDLPICDPYHHFWDFRTLLC